MATQLDDGAEPVNELDRLVAKEVAELQQQQQQLAAAQEATNNVDDEGRNGTADDAEKNHDVSTDDVEKDEDAGMSDGREGSGEEDELERIATEELLREAKRGAERAREVGIFGWQKSPVPPTNKRFLSNTLISTLRHPFRRKRHRSRSRSRSHSPKSRSRHSEWSDKRKYPRRQHSKESSQDTYHGHSSRDQMKDLENIRPDYEQNSWDSPEIDVNKQTRSRSNSIDASLRKRSKSDKKRSKSGRSSSVKGKSKSKKHKSSSRKKDKDKKSKVKSKNKRSEKKKHSHKSKHKKRRK